MPHRCLNSWCIYVCESPYGQSKNNQAHWQHRFYLHNILPRIFRFVPSSSIYSIQLDYQKFFSDRFIHLCHYNSNLFFSLLFVLFKTCFIIFHIKDSFDITKRLINLPIPIFTLHKTDSMYHNSIFFLTSSPSPT